MLDMPDQVIIEATRVENINIFIVYGQLVPGNDLEQFIQGAKTPGQYQCGITKTVNGFFPDMHVIGNDEFRDAQVLDFPFKQQFGNDTRNFSAMFHYCVRDNTHDTRGTAAIDKFNIVFCHQLAQLAGLLGKQRVNAFL